MVERGALLMSGSLFMAACGQSAPAMPEPTFKKAADLCSLKRTTYLRRDGLFLDEPLINFSKETQPSTAHRCFNAALQKVDAAVMAAGAKHVGYIWEWTE